MRSLVIDWRVCVESHSTDNNGVDETHAANRLSIGLTYDGYQYRTAVFYTKLLFIVFLLHGFLDTHLVSSI